MIKVIKRVSIIGSGNVAYALGRILKQSDLSIVEVFSRDYRKADVFAQFLDSTPLHNLAALNPNTDLLLVAVKDDALEEVFMQIPHKQIPAIHTSGSWSMDTMHEWKYYGALYPLQTFSKEREIDLSEVPFFVEANSVDFQQVLIDFAAIFTHKTYLIDSEQRVYLHLAAVMANNFTNHLYRVAQELLEEKGLDFRYLIPLIEETASKVKTLTPAKAQTGPAARNDISILMKHLELLSNYPDYQTIYTLLSNQITSFNQNKK